MKVLDLFCGLGGWSKGFAELGYECTGVDIKNIGYPYKFIQADILDWMPNEYFDVIVASPPCTSFSWVNHKWNGKPMTGKGLDLVFRTYEIISKMKPQYWIIENVRGLSKYIEPPMEVIRYGHSVHRKEAYLWGNIGKLGFFPFDSYKRTSRKTYKDTNPVLAEIPIQLSRAVAERCLTEKAER